MGRGVCLTERPGPVTAEPEEEETLLSFPAKIVVEPGSARGVIADTNHHRSGHRLAGGGRVCWSISVRVSPGLMDGHFAMARFRRPQGLTWAEGKLYVADTGNHALRVVDLERHTVVTLAGTGEHAPEGVRGGRAREVPLNSPWDVVVCGGALYVTLAGAHQVWRMELHGEEIHPHAGTGQKARVDGPLAGRRVCPARGNHDRRDAAVCGGERDERACARWMLDPEGKVETLAGGDLFAFGDRDGLGRLARFQHPLGLAYDGGHSLLGGQLQPQGEDLHVSPPVCPPRSLQDSSCCASRMGCRWWKDVCTSRTRTGTRSGWPTWVRVAWKCWTCRPRPNRPRFPLMPEFFGQVQQRPRQTIGPGRAVLTASVTVPPNYRSERRRPPMRCAARAGWQYSRRIVSRASRG